MKNEFSILNYEVIIPHEQYSSISWQSKMAILIYKIKLKSDHFVFVVPLKKKNAQ